MLLLTRLLPSFFVAWLLSFSLASLFHSLYVVNQLVNVGILVTFNDRVHLIIADWQGLLLTYGAIIAVAYALAFWLANRINHNVNQQKELIYLLAGLGAIAIVLIASESIMHVHIIAGARGWGFYAQLLSGAVGGLLFARISAVLAVKNNHEINC
ncbi:hypothetical protein [Pseudoalteromonas sp.]|uniref:hypothetical protein n=1 Tax=Pseudoalteromonas sp. TaxID=53249 RepID=UPI003569BA75